jgi:hypothetical protein
MLLSKLLLYRSFLVFLLIRPSDSVVELFSLTRIRSDLYDINLSSLSILNFKVVKAAVLYTNILLEKNRKAGKAQPQPLLCAVHLNFPSFNMVVVFGSE